MLALGSRGGGHKLTHQSSKHQKIIQRQLPPSQLADPAEVSEDDDNVGCALQAPRFANEPGRFGLYLCIGCPRDKNHGCGCVEKSDGSMWRIECKGVTGTLPQQRHIKGFDKVVVGPQRGTE